VIAPLPAPIYRPQLQTRKQYLERIEHYCFAVEKGMKRAGLKRSLLLSEPTMDLPKGTSSGSPDTKSLAGRRSE
jgi:hypothetical protein